MTWMRTLDLSISMTILTATQNKTAHTSTLCQAAQSLSKTKRMATIPQEPIAKLAWSSQGTTESGQQWLNLVATGNLRANVDASVTGSYLVVNHLIPETCSDTISVHLVDNGRQFDKTKFTVSPRAVNPRMDVVERVCGRESVELLQSLSTPILLAASALVMFYAGKSKQETIDAIQGAFKKESE